MLIKKNSFFTIFHFVIVSILVEWLICLSGLKYNVMIRDAWHISTLKVCLGWLVSNRSMVFAFLVGPSTICVKDWFAKMSENLMWGFG